MNKYCIVTQFEEIKNTPGIWVETEYDDITSIWEKTGARYMVPFSKDKIIDVNTGSLVGDAYVNIINKRNVKTSYTTSTYRWLLADKFNEYLL